MAERKWSLAAKRIVDLGSAVAMIVASALVIWAVLKAQAAPGSHRTPGVQAASTAAKPGSPPRPTKPISIDGAITRGNPRAPLALVEYSDFQCPFCARFARGAYGTIVTEFIESGRVLMAFRNLPLERLHPLAFAAAEVASCAGANGKFWQVHDAFFNNPKAMKAISDYEATAVSTGVLASDLGVCLAQPTTKTRIEQDVESAKALGITGTPVFFIGSLSGKQVNVSDVISGAQPAEVFREKLAGALR